MCFLSFFDRTIFQNNWYPLHLGAWNTPSQQKPPSLYRFDLGGGEIDPFSSSCLPEFRVCRGRKMPSFYQKKHLTEVNPPEKNLPIAGAWKRELRSWMYQKSPFIGTERLGANPQVSISTSWLHGSCKKHIFFQRKIIWAKTCILGVPLVSSTGGVL